MKITRVRALQAHPVPDKIHDPRGPFPDHLFDEPEINTEYVSEGDEAGAEYELGATAQNNYKPTKYFRCRTCHARVVSTDLDVHTCED